MTFGEKLLKLRKEKGLSQEALAEQLGATRQAVSKWENGQGFPETEKLLAIGNVFEVSIDYLLKEQTEESSEDEKGYYVSREMAEGHLIQERKVSKYVAGGLGIAILGTVPYLLDGFASMTSIIASIILVTLGIGSVIMGAMMEEDRYRVLKRELLIFDQNYLRELRERYAVLRKKYVVLIIGAVCFVIMGGAPFLFVDEGWIAANRLEVYYPLCVFLIAIGIALLVHTVSVLEAYELIVKNEEHTKKLSFRILKKARKKLDEI
ncbi:MAG: helix-turn-helix domain-containing protein [Cellulosilyticaceae bacterium]